MGYKEDPNNPGRMIPDDMPGYLKPHATTPRSGSVVDRPSHVIVAEDRTGLWFNFESTASLGYDIGTDVVYNATNNWVWLGTFADGTRLDISPIAWSGSHADHVDGDVIFVYNDGSSGQE